jgi:hypothetical protein
MAKPKTYRAEAVLKLPAALRLQPELGGLLKSATICGLDVHVVLPDFEFAGDDFEPRLHRRARVDWLDAFAKKNEDPLPGFPFGEAVCFRKGKITQLLATRLLVLPRSELTRAQARQLRDGADAWLDLLATWIEVVYRRDLQLQTFQTEHIGKSAYVWLDRGAKGELFGERQQLYVNLAKTPLIGKREWGSLLAKVSAGTQPPEAHVFLRDARHAQNIGRYRRSVLDSATAAELSLAKLRDTILSSGDKRVANYVGNKARSLNAIVEFLKKMKQALPVDIKESIAEPRNLAIHHGQEPDELTASKALRTADEVVELAFPWKGLL